MLSEVVHSDYTADTDHKEGPVPIITGWDSTAKMLNSIRAFLPDEGAQVLLAVSDSDANIAIVKEIQTDGNTQETSHMDSAVASISNSDANIARDE